MSGGPAFDDEPSAFEALRRKNLNVSGKLDEWSRLATPVSNYSEAYDDTDDESEEQEDGQEEEYEEEYEVSFPLFRNIRC